MPYFHRLALGVGIFCFMPFSIFPFFFFPQPAVKCKWQRL